MLFQSRLTSAKVGSRLPPVIWTRRLLAWIDRGWQSPPIRLQSRRSSLSVTLPAVSFVLLNAAVHLPKAIFWLGVGILSSWGLLVHWRGWLAFRRFARDSDRRYDRKGKFNLPPEYYSTESATAAGERKRRKRKRGS